MAKYQTKARTFGEFIAIAEAVVYGGEKKEPKDTRMIVTASDRKANTKAWQNYLAGHSGYRAASHLNKEEHEIDEAKSDAGLSVAQKRQVRTARQGYAGVAIPNSSLHTGDISRRAAHRDRDEMNKDAKDIRKGKLNQPQFQGRTGQERVAIVKKAKGMK